MIPSHRRHRDQQRIGVYLFATLDTKGREAEFLRERLRACGTGNRWSIPAAQGTPCLRGRHLRAKSCFVRGRGRPNSRPRLIVEEPWRRRRRAQPELVRASARPVAYPGPRQLGGSAGTTIGSAAMRALPLGVPKLLVSTLASGQVRHYVGDKDILMLNAVVDISGLNRISRTILDEAARAMAGMVCLPAAPTGGGDKPLVAATMFGVTTPCVERARQVLEEAGYEVLVFHATGAGGQAMESLITDGLIAGVLDITTTELADEFAGGMLSAGPNRLTAAGRAGIPQVVSVGATDMANFHARDTVPERFRDRHLYQHNASVARNARHRRRKPEHRCRRREQDCYGTRTNACHAARARRVGH